MHIAFVLPDLKGGGAQKMIINLANWFSARGHKVDLVVFNSDGVYRDLVQTDVTLHDLKCRRSIKAIMPLRSYINIKKPELLFSAIIHVNIICILSRIFLKYKVKLVISERNNIMQNFHQSSLFVFMFWRILLSILYPMSDYVITISDGVARELKRFLFLPALCKIMTIYNPVVTDEFDALLSRPSKTNIFSDDCRLKLITSGRLVEQKDYPTLLRAFALCLKEEPKAELVILGDGALRSVLEDLCMELKIEQQVSFMGFVDNPLAYLAQGDVFVMSSAWEGFCNVIVEALYCGLDVAVTDCVSGPAEILENGIYGTLVEVGNVNALAKAILATRSVKNDAFRQKSRAMDFHVGKIGVQFEEKFAELVRV